MTRSTYRMYFRLSIFTLATLICSNLIAQTEPAIEGEVSYLTSQNVYVKFVSTEAIQPSDTLYQRIGDELVPVLVVVNKSSISCVCRNISNLQLKVKDVILGFQENSMSDVVENNEVIAPDIVETADTSEIEEALDEILKPQKRKKELRGRLSVSSYSNFSNTSAVNSNRMRYTFSLKGQNIGGSKLSTNNYISFRHKFKEWDDVQENVFNALKIYSLSAKYDFSDNTSVSIGRKINRNLSNIGAVDGLQLEHRLGDYTVGGILGSRPDNRDYSLNLSLLQYGAYIKHLKEDKNGQMQTSLAMIEQRNSGNTDRRFAYFQHMNSLIKRIFIFTSFEVDLFKNVKEEKSNVFNLTSLYLSLRYRPNRKIALFASYDTRKNVIYYETYKDIIEQLLEAENRQGLRFQISYRPLKYLNIGSSVGYRFQKESTNSPKTMHTYISYSRIPLLKASATLSWTLLDNSYLDGSIYGLRLSRDLIRGKVYGSATYRYIDYKYSSNEFLLEQNVIGVNISWRLKRKLSLSVNYEGTFEKENKYGRVYINLRKRL